MNNKRAQSILEMVVLIVAFVAAFLAMQGYIRGALQGHWREQADSFSDEQYQKDVSKEESFPYLVARQPAIVISNTNLSAVIKENDNTGKLVTTHDVHLDLQPGPPLKVEYWGTYHEKPKED